MSQHQAAQQAAQTSGLDNIIVGILNMPPSLAAVLLISIGAGGAAYYFLNHHDPEDTLDKTTMQERIKNTFILPTYTAGSPVMDWVYHRSTENTKKLLGLAVRAESTEDKVIVEPDFDNKNEQEEELFSSVQYGVLPGGNKLKASMKWPLWRASLLLPWVETGALIEWWDLPKNKMDVSEQGIIMDHSFYPIKKNGLWRDHSTPAQDKITQRTFADAHQDWAEAMQQLPEIYSQLNSRVAGQLNVMDRKSKNIRQYKEEQSRRERGEALDN